MKLAFFPACKLKVNVTIVIEAEDFLDAGEHQKRLEEKIAPLLEAYPAAEVTVSRARGVKEGAGRPPRRVQVPSGRVNQYG
jgi:hypothetical protein